MKKILAVLVAVLIPVSLMADSVKAPAFSLPNRNGDTVSLGDYAGKIVVLEWTNPDCPFVKRHYSEGTMKGLQAKYAPKGVVWLAIDSTNYMDSAADQKWAEAQGITYPILSDKDGVVGKEYGAKTTPHLFVIDTEGNIAYSGAVDDDREGSKSDRTLYVDQVLSELTSGRAVTVQSTAPYGCSVKYKS